MNSPQPRLDGAYTIFGQVIEVMDSFNKIFRDDTIERVEILDAK